jgi:uncharacterized membrane protein
MQLAYSNWAAIDLFRHGYAISTASPSYLAAMATTTLWCAYHNALQLLICMFLPFDAPERLMVRRVWVLYIGALLPMTQTARITTQPLVELANSGHAWEGTLIYTARTFDSGHRSPNDAFSIAFPAIFHGFFLLVVIYRFRRHKVALDEIPVMVTLAGQVIAIIACVATAMALTSAKQRTCFLRPCAPQTIRDWEQAYCLFGLGVLMYEVGADLKRAWDNWRPWWN